MVEKLILLSPVGLCSKYTHIESTKIEDFLQKAFFKAKKPPTYAYKMFGGAVSNFVFNHVCNENKFKGLKIKEEFLVFRDFLNVMFRNDAGSEQAGFNFFDKNLRAYKPLTFYYENLKDTKILILYGDVDWSPIKHAEELQKLLPDTVEIDMVTKSGHVLYTDNYEECTQKIIAFFESEKQNEDTASETSNSNISDSKSDKSEIVNI